MSVGIITVCQQHSEVATFDKSKYANTQLFEQMDFPQTIGQAETYQPYLYDCTKM